MTETIFRNKSGESANLLQLVGFKLGEEEFGVDILKVQEINRMVEITKVPQSPPFVEGIINLRGMVIPVIDLRKRLNMSEKEIDKDKRIIVAELDECTLGFVVDSVTEIIRIPSSTVEPPPPITAGSHSEYIMGVGKLDEKLLMLLDMNKVFSTSEIKQITTIKTPSA